MPHFQETQLMSSSGNNNRTIIIVVAVVVLLCCCCAVVGTAGWFCGDLLTGASQSCTF